MPCSFAASGESTTNISPLDVIEDPCSVYTADKILMSVDFSASLAPNSPSTSPEWSVKSTPFRTRFAPKDFVIPVSWRAIGFSGDWDIPVTPLCIALFETGLTVPAHHGRKDKEEPPGTTLETDGRNPRHRGPIGQAQLPHVCS